MTLDRAIAIALEAHRGQTDKAGAPYILHPLRVMLALDTAEAQIVGVLHDVVEDCPAWTLDRLRAEGFSQAVVDGVEAVTRRAGESYPDFVDRAGLDALGRAVKIADLEDNLSPARALPPALQDEARMTRYRAALSQLQACNAAGP